MSRSAEKYVLDDKASAEAPAVRDSAGRRRGFGSSVWAVAVGSGERLALLVVWAITVLIFCVLEPSTFYTWGNFTTIFGQQAVLLVLALGLIVPLTAGDFDLSVASNLGFSAMVVALLNVNRHWSIGWAVAVAVLIGISIGFINGAIIVWMGVDSFIVTLGTGTVLYGMTEWLSNSNTISGISTSLSNVTIGDRLGGISLLFYYGIVFAVAMWYVLSYTAVGRRVLFLGRSREVSRLSGLHVDRLRIGSFVFCGLVAAIAGVLYAGELGSADPSSAQSFLLPAYAAVFLGSTAIIPGRFNAVGLVVAVYFLATGITGLQILGARDYVQQLFYGAALVLAVTLSRIVRRRSRAREAA